MSLLVSSSPHIRTAKDTRALMRDVLIALSPAVLAALLFFRVQAFWVIAVSVSGAVATEFIIQKLCRHQVTVTDCSAAVTGLLLAMNMPPSVPLWLPLVGSMFAIAIVKQLFGGVGRNFVNPALAARGVLMASWPVHMTTWTPTAFMADTVSGATPLAILRGAGGQIPQWWELLLGNTMGCIGETSALALFAGGVFLLARGVINWRIPVCYLGTVAVLSFVIGGPGWFDGPVITLMLSGGLMLGACFMATDYVTSPVTPTGRILMGVGCGILTVVIRRFGGYPEGVSYAILLMNVATPVIERYTLPKMYGGVRKVA